MKLALPVVLSMIVSLVYNMVDTYFIALTGVQELVRVSLVAPMFTLMIAFGDIFGLGGSSSDFKIVRERRKITRQRKHAHSVSGYLWYLDYVSVQSYYYSVHRFSDY